MKNLNLIKRLWTDSHEKQSPQRFARYAVMLMMLLTLGVGQMWADLFVPGLWGGWDSNNNIKLVDRGSNVYSAYFQLNAQKYTFKINNGSWGDSNDYNRGKNDSGQPSVGTAYSMKKNGDNMEVTISTAGLYLFSVNTSTWKLTITQVKPTEAAPSNVVSGTNVMFYIQGYNDNGADYLTNGSAAAATSYPMNFDPSYSYVNTAKTNLSTYNHVSDNPTGWSGITNSNISNATGGELFVANGSTSKTAAKTLTTHTTSMSGDVLTITTKTSGTTGSCCSMPLYIQYYIDETFAGVTYSAATASYASIKATGSNQTATYNCSSLTNGTHVLKTVLTDGLVYYVAATDNFTVAHTYSITYKDEGNSDYSGSNEASLPSSYTYGTGVSLTDGKKTGYDFDGWFNNSGCTGDAVTSVSTTATGDKTFYADWTEKTYSLTFSHNGHGTISVGGSEVSSGSTASVNYFTTKTLVADPDDGYHFTGWTLSGTNTSAVTIADVSEEGASTTIKATNTGATVTAGFAADDVNSLTVSAGTGISSVTGSTSPVTLGSKYDISATAATGYTFSTWTASPVANGTFDNASSASTKVQVNNGSVTVTASATENMSSLSVSRTIDEGTPSIAAPTVTDSRTTVGYVTTAEITAASAATGYAFTGWTLTNCTRTDGGGATANPITIKSDGDGEDVSVVANYAIQSYTISASNSNVTYSPSSGTSFKFGATGKKMTITPKSGYKITGITSSNVAISASADNNAAGSWSVTGTMPAANVTLTVTTAAVPEIRVVGRFKIYNSTRTVYTTVNGSNDDWEEDYSDSHLSMTYNYVTGFYDLATYRSTSELTADVAPYFFLKSSSTKYGTSSGGNTDLGSSVPVSANVHSSGGGGNFHFNSNADLINVVLHFDKENYKFWFTGEEETSYSTTFYAGDHGSINAKGTSISKNGNASVSIGYAKALTATPESGYLFDYWETTGSVTVADIYSASTTVTATAASGTVRAHYSAVINSGWYAHGVIDSYGEWGTDKKARPIDRSYRGVSGVYYRRVTKLDNNAYFGVHDGTNKYSGHTKTDVDYDVTSLNTQITLYTNDTKSFQAKDDFAGDWLVVNTNGTKKMWLEAPTTYYTVSFANGTSGNTGNGVAGTEGTITVKENVYCKLATKQYASGETINITVSAKDGYWIDDISFNGSSLDTDVDDASWEGTATMPSANATLTVTYHRIYALSYNANGGSGDAPATTYHISGTNATAATNTFTGRTNYSFAGWNTTEYITGSTYAAGASVKMDADITLYAKWNRTVDLEQEDADTDGSTSVIGTWNCATLPSITNPEKEGYDFDGWYTEEAGSGNIVINTSGVLQPSKTNWTDAEGRFKRTPSAPASETKPLYAKWVQTVELDANTANHGSGDDGAATIVYKATSKTSITHCSPATGYQRTGYYTAATDGTKILNADGTFAGNDIEDYIDEDGKWVKEGDTELYAQYEPITYTVTLNPGLGGTGDPGTMTVDYDATAYKTFSHSITQTGYSIEGWYTNDNPNVKVLNGNGSFASSSVSGYITGGKWTKASNCDLYAHWTPNPYAITFDATTNGGDIVSGSSPQNVIFDETSVGSCPTAAKEGYCFDGWYTAATSGKKVINPDGSFVANVTDWTDEDGKWKVADEATVYAVYVKPEIIMTQGGKGLISSMPGYDTLIVNQSFGCTPAADYNISYTVGYKVSHTQLAPQPKINYCAAAVAGVRHDTIIMPVADGANSYEVVAYLKTGTTRGSGTDVTTDTLNVDVETSYAVKVRAVVDGVEIAEERLALLYPSFAAIHVTIWKEINGYQLDHIDLGVGVTQESVSEEDTYYWNAYYAANASTITAVYKPKANTVYLFNADTHNYCMYAASRTKLYDYGTGGYWHTSGETQKGAGSYNMTGDTVVATGMGSSVWMASIGGSTTSFAFTSDKLNGVEEFYSYTASNSSKLPAHVIYRTDYNATLPMFVPVAKDKDDCYIINKNGDDGWAQYYRGFWVKRSPDLDSTGYYLKVYDKVSGDPAPKLIQSVPLRLTQTGEDGTWELTATIDLEANKTYGFKFTKATGANSVVWYADTNEGTMTSAAHTGWDNFVTEDKKNTGLTTTAAGDYTFHIYCVDYGTKDANAATATDVQGKFAVTVDYAAESGDYRVIYSDATQTEVISSPSIRPRANGQDTVSFFIRKSDASRVMKIQQFTSSWGDVSTVDLSTIAKDSVYVIYLEQNEAGTSISTTGIDFYDGDYYIRTDCVDEYKWDYKKSLENHRMIPTDYGMTAKQPDPFSHYYVHWLTGNSNVKFIVANKYAPCLSDTVITDDWVTDTGGNLGEKGANIRFMYNKGTNKAMRAYLYGSQENDNDYLKLSESTTSGYMKNRSGSVISSITFSDLGNFTYQALIAAHPGLRGKLTAKYLSTTQYFLGSEDSDEELIGGSTGEFQNILLTYDFKSNRLICAWQPSGATITEDLDINADIMIIRKAQGDAQQIRFSGSTKIDDVHYIYGVIEFEYNDMYHMMYTWDWWSYSHCMYYISFPFDVLVNDIAGVGTLGVDWKLQRYNGAKRAEKGWFLDGEKTFWEDIHAGDTLHAYEGYSLLLARSRFNGTAGNIWDNKTYGDKVYLYFPSVSPIVGELSNQEVTISVPAHTCTKNQTFVNSYGMLVNHKVTDSHWNMIGTPMFADTTAFSIATGPEVETGYGRETLQYVYAWSYYGNTLGIKSTLDTDWRFKTMYSYMAQYCGDIVFKGPAINKVVAAKRNEEKKNYHVKLEISKDDMFIGRTYIELRENAVDSFLLNEDICMFRNGVNADLFTYAGGYEAGANVLPIANQVVPVGIAVKQAGTYVFSMPANFDGEVILVDKYAQTRTNLMLEDYEVALPTGEITDRFEVEININKVATAIDGTNGDGSLKDGNAHKFIENGMMYILQNGALYDAQGKRVK